MRFTEAWLAGTSWTPVTSLANPTFSVRFDPHVSSVAYALGTGGFYKSTDGGVTFAAVSSGFTNGEQLVVSPTQSGRFFATRHTTPAWWRVPTEE